MRWLLGPWLPAERHVTLHDRQERSPDARNPVQSSKGAERATRIPIGNNAFRQPRPDSRQPGQFFRSRPIKIDTLPRVERPVQRDRTVLVCQGRLSGQRLDQLDLPGGLAGAAGDQPGSVPGHRQGEKQDEGFAFGWRHRGNGGAARDDRHNPFPAARVGKLRYFSCATRATATSPTIWRLAALTLSIVSSGVCQEG